MAQGEFRLRPLNVTEIIDEAFSIYRRNFWLLFGIAVIPYLLQSLAQAYPTMMLERAEPEDLDAVFTALFGLFGVAALAWFAVEIAGAAMASAISERVLGRQASIGHSYGRIGRRLLLFTGYLILKGLILFAGWMFCCIPGIVLYCFLFVSVCPFIIEGRGPVQSLDRSMRLTTGHGLKAFALLIVSGLIVALVSYGILGIFWVVQVAFPILADPHRAEFVYWSVLQAIATGIALSFVVPIATAVLVLFYYDLRVRKEAFDLEVLASNLGANR